MHRPLLALALLPALGACRNADVALLTQENAAL